MPYPLTAILSDLHSNLQAVWTAVADARERGARRYVCLGDVIGYGARPLECLTLVRALCASSGAHDPETREALEGGLCLRGNHEDALLTSSAEDFNPKARAAIEWTRGAINAAPDRDEGYASWDFLGELEPSACDEIAMFAHGSPRDPVREYLLPPDGFNAPKMRACFAAIQRDVCFVGHSHVPAVYVEHGGDPLRPYCNGGPERLPLSEFPGERVIVNVGSVGQPRDNDPRLSYALFDGEAVTFVRLEYDHAAAADEIRAVADLPDYLADRLAVGR